MIAQKFTCSKTINPVWIGEIRKVANHCPYFKLQNMALKDLDWGISRVEIELLNRHMQPFGVVHGGVFASLIDASGFWAVYSKANASVSMTTVDLKINYLAPAVSGRLIGLGSCIKLGRNLGLAEARIENDQGRLLAYGTTTAMVQKENSVLGKNQDIPKFL